MSRSLSILGLVLCALPAFALPDASAPAVSPKAEPVTIQLSVTANGFEPASVKVQKGVPVKLVITRKTRATCAKEIVIKDYDINVTLPLDTPVEVLLTPLKAGEIHYACAMNMIKGVLLVQ